MCDYFLQRNVLENLVFLKLLEKEYRDPRFLLQISKVDSIYIILHKFEQISMSDFQNICNLRIFPIYSIQNS